MNLCLFKRVAHILLALVVTTFSMFAPIYAQSSEAQQQLAAAAKTPQMILNDLEQNERALYELFNALNGSDKNDIICSAVPLENADSYRQLCEPVFLEEIRQEVEAELAQNSKTKTSFFARIRNAFLSREERAERLLLEKAGVPVEFLQKEIESLATVHPNLLAQLTTIAEIQREYLQTLEIERRSRSYLMRQNEASYDHGSIGQAQRSGPQLTLSAPPPGYTQPTLNYGYRGPLAN
jgi:hypothetical protein